jgi:hypothetical protein
MIEKSEPKCIVIANAFASHVYKSYHKLSFSDALGCYTQVIAGHEIPVFLSSMLTGGNMDIYTLERLAWHVGQVVKSGT